MALTPKQEAFVVEYLKCRNATEAARRVGYAHPNKQGPRLLVNVGILAEIQERTAEKAMGLNEALGKLGDIARGTMEDFVSFTYEPYPCFVLDLGKAKERGMLHLIKKLEYDKDGNPKIELYSAADANKVIVDLHTKGPKGTEDDPYHMKHTHELSDAELQNIASRSSERTPTT